MDITVPDAFTGFNIGTIDVGKNAVPYTDGMNGGTTVSLMSLDKMTGDGNLFKIYLDIEGVDLKEFTIKVKCLSAGDSEGKNVMFSATDPTTILNVKTGKTVVIRQQIWYTVKQPDCIGSYYSLIKILFLNVEKNLDNRLLSLYN